METLPRKITRMLTISWPFNMDLNLQRKRHFKKGPYIASDLNGIWESTSQ